MLFCSSEKPPDEVWFKNFEAPDKFRKELKHLYKAIFRLENFGGKYITISFYYFSSYSVLV